MPVNDSNFSAEPTLTLLKKFPFLLKNTTEPPCCFTSASTATATTPLWLTATLLAPPPWGDTSMVKSNVGFLGLLMSNTSTSASVAFTTKSLLLLGS